MRFIIFHFFKIGEKKLLFKTLINVSEKIAKKIIVGNTFFEKVRCFESIFSVIGQGIPFVKKNGKIILCTLLFPPADKGIELYQAFLVNGYLNYIFQKNLKLFKITTSRNPFRISFFYK